MEEQSLKINGMCISGLVLALLLIPIVFIMNAVPYLTALKIVGVFAGAVNLLGILTFKPRLQRGRILAIIGLVLSVTFIILSQTNALTRDYI